MTFVASTCYQPLTTQGMGTWLLQPEGCLSLGRDPLSVDPLTQGKR